ncbi:hypothetical protein [Embleya sp. NPDC020886]|uniref:hypothetical protein n=1 Tax=Embleya sp. NPDC020886 TaxID=3363980 RepID=UPI003798C62E
MPGEDVEAGGLRVHTSVAVRLVDVVEDPADDRFEHRAAFGAPGRSSARAFAARLDAEARRPGLGVVFDERTVRRWLSGHSR